MTAMPTYNQSPYAFVPVSEHVIFPDWANRVSQDIPFSDGLDGELTLTITALSQLFIRDGRKPDRANPQNKADNFFQTADGTYCIPGSSLKGMLRNVLEIASFSKMQRVSDRRYAIRDLNLKKYTNQFVNTNLSSKVQAGLLDVSSPDWKIYPCDYALWDRQEFDRDFGNRRMSAAEKYQAWSDKYKKLDWSATIEWRSKNAKGKAIIPHNHATLTLHGNDLQSGVVVFTGQPQDYKPGKTAQKHHEFFFYHFDKAEPIWVDPPETITQDEYGNDVRRNQQDFIFAHCEQSQAGDLDNWNYKNEKNKLSTRQSFMTRIRERYFNNRIPVFYLTNDDGSLRSFGLSQLFRLTGKLSIADALRNVNPDHYARTTADFKPDLSDLLFGYVNGKNDALRGRVYVSPCLAQNQPQPDPTLKLILGEPRPSFYPAYLQQPEGLKEKKDYQTFLDNNAKLRGWKRYPALNENWQTANQVEQNADPDQRENDKIWTSLQPLPVGTVFQGTIRYHNLRPIELGALLWAIQLKNSKYYCHSIGMAKPYGFGKIKIDIAGELSEDDRKSYCKQFTDYIAQQLATDKFEQLPQIQALLNMAAYGNQKVDWGFSYLDGPKAYTAIKGNLQKNEPAAYLADYPKPTPIQPPQSSNKPTAASPAAQLTPEQAEFKKRVLDGKVKGNDFYKKLPGFPKFPKSDMDEMTAKIPPNASQKAIVKKCTL